MLYREAVADRRARLVQDQMSLLASGQALLLQQRETAQDPQLKMVKRTAKQPHRLSYVRSNPIFKTPAWLSRTVWEMAIDRAISGWTFSLRSYNLWCYVNPPIADACVYGEVACIQRSFDRREVSPFDEIDMPFKMSLLDVGQPTAYMPRLCLS
jgi:hypothetical protein